MSNNIFKCTIKYLICTNRYNNFQLRIRLSPIKNIKVQKAFCSTPKNFSFYERRRKRRFVQFQRIFPFTKCDGKGVFFYSKEFSLLRNATEKAFCSIPKNFPLYEMRRKRRFVQFQRIFLFTKCDEKGVLFNSKEFSSLRNATKK